MSFNFCKMNILILGSGGREHAFAWKIAQSTLCEKLFIAPGNAGTQLHGKNISIEVDDFAAIRKFCLEENIEMVVVGAEDPLVKGIYNFFANDTLLKQILVIGPSAEGAQLEGSKSFSKHFMQRHHIPTAGYAEFTIRNFDEGIKYLQSHSLPIVLKADGLAAGKGVVICENLDDAIITFTAMIKDRQFGVASETVVVEEFLKGIEVSVFVLTDGNDYKIIGHAKDYKRIGEGDTGLNTGGMGCVSPLPFMDSDFMKVLEETIIRPTIEGIQIEKMEYKGFIFFGLINVEEKPYVIEYNCRMGDPETEVVLPRLKNDLVELLASVHQQTLAQQNIEIDTRACSTVVAVSGGYPRDYETGFSIHGLKNRAKKDVLLFHAGTKPAGEAILTDGGRVLAASAFGNTLGDSLKKATDALATINFEGMYFRKDIGWEFI